MSSVNLPVKKGDDFLGEIESMDLSEIRDKLFLVGVCKGNREENDLFIGSAHGPYNFMEMIQEVGYMWKRYLHHSKVIILEKDRGQLVKNLDTNTVDYIEANFEDLIFEETFNKVLIEDQTEFTCKVGLNESKDDPRLDVKDEQ